MPRSPESPEAGTSEVPTRWWTAIALAASWFAIAATVAPRLVVAPLLAYGVAFGSVCAMALAVAAHAPSRGPALVVAVPAVAGLLALHRMGVVGATGGVLVLVCLLTVGTAIGAAVGARIEHPGHLLFVAPVSALADVVSVHHPDGVSAAIIADQAALSVLALPFPMLGTGAIEPLLGVGDVVFIALYFAVARAHGLSRFRTLVGLSLALVVTAVTVVITELAIPALPFLGAGMLLSHAQTRRPPVKDRRAGVLGLGLLAVAAACLFYFRS